MKNLLIILSFLLFEKVTQAQSTPIELGDAIAQHFKTGQTNSIGQFIATPDEIIAYIKQVMPDYETNSDSTESNAKYQNLKANFLFNIKDTYHAHDSLFWATAKIKIESKNIQKKMNLTSNQTIPVTQLEIHFRTPKKVLIITFTHLFKTKTKWVLGDQGFHVSVNGE